MIERLSSSLSAVVAPPARSLPGPPGALDALHHAELPGHPVPQMDGPPARTLPGPAGALDALQHAALTGSPVAQGEAMRALDETVGPQEANRLAQPAVLRGTDAPAAIVRVQDARSAGRIDLTQHEGRGVPPSHTIALHVGKSRDFLMRMMQPISTEWASAYRTRHSTFSSLESANALVSATLATGREVSPGVFYREFSSPTGTAAVRRDMIPLIRPQGRVGFETPHGVLVVTRPDAGMPGGFRVQTAYPTVPFSGRAQ